MKANFFEQLQQISTGCNWKISIAQGCENKLVVSVLMVGNSKDGAEKLIPPMNFSGTAQELDEQFFTLINEPAQQTAGLLTNMAQYMKQLEETKAQSQMERDKENQERKEKDERKKKFAELMKKVGELEEKKQYQLAIATLPKAEQYPEQAEEIKKKLEELRKNNSQLSLMD